MTVALGIDLGTTNSVAAIATPTGVEFILGARAERVHPSVVALPDAGGVVVGSDAKRYRLTEPQHVIYSAKRFIGQNIRAPLVQLAMTGVRYKVAEGTNQQPIVVVRDRRLTMPEISSHVLLHLKRCAERQLGTQVKDAVITVPANFTDGQRQATKEAGRLAGLEVMRLINEPTAAALAYGFGHERDQRIAVFDFGGGTFDVSLLKLAGDVYEVLASDGDFFLGGDDLDRSLTELLAAECNRILRFDPRPNPQLMMKLMMGAEAIKCHLSENDAAEGEIDGLDLPSGKVAQLPFQITRRQFEDMIAGYVQRTIDVTRQVLIAAQLEAHGIDDILCVGGSTRIPLVRRRLAELFNKDPNVGINPDEVVAQGAAIQAGSLTNTLTAGTGMGVAHSVPTHEHSPLSLELVPEITTRRPSSTQAPAATRSTQRGYQATQPPAPQAPQAPAPVLPPLLALVDVPVRRPILLDVNPATLAIHTAGGFTERLLDKNSPIPIERSRVFTTARDNQTKVEIDCCRGEARRYTENEPLGTLVLDKLPPKLRGDVQIEVSFRVDADGILHVRATDAVSGAKQEAYLNVLGAPSAEAKLEPKPESKA
ncbi:MAG: Hsp70 family protein [Deltaproteobacteria bacterium]|nr:Hsp70 family protein [Deltaproteobacteria bacterium]